METTPKRLFISLVVVACAATVLAPAPASGQSTSDRVDAQRERVSERRAEYERLAGEYVQQQSELGATENRITETEAEMKRAEDEIGDLGEQLKDRVRTAYRMGGIGFFQFLLEARSLRDFSLRMITLERQSSEDEGLILELRRKRAELERKQRDLEGQKTLQERQLAALRQKGRTLEISLGQAEALYRELQGQLRREQLEDLFRVRRGGSVGGLQIPLDFCPVAAPRTFTNDWGNPRGGGTRRHKGTDVFAAHGHPVLAVVSGTITRHRSGGLGGLAIYMWGDDGNEYYYAHLSRFNTSPGQRVTAGDVIAGNGNTGNARGGAPHVHFEIHPGGGSAINPYPSLVRVC